MSRPKGSKNRVIATIGLVKPEETEEQIPKEDLDLLGMDEKPKTFEGYDQVTGEPIWI